MSWVHTVVDALHSAGLLATALGFLWQNSRMRELETLQLRAYADLCEQMRAEKRARERAEAELRRYLNDVAAITLPTDILDKVRPKGD